MRLEPSRWRQIAAIYESAIERDPVERDAFLARACFGDDALRREVESLLRQDSAEVVLDRSVWAAAAAVFDDDLTLGRDATLGPYRIECPLGAGGMGTVFRALDTRLGRPVAIKVLPTGVALDPEMRARFALEAKAIAALTHPHICTLYDVGRQDDIDFLVMECLEGETLASRLAAAGRLPVEQAVACAIEIASALDHAHRQDVVHRDLKPSNIMLTAGGAKLLDFGLAKVLTIARRSESGAETAADTGTGRPHVHHEELTQHDTLIGTLRYMAPEQLRGQAADVRSDLFSFGVVLYEMLTGTRAFDAHTGSTVRDAILQDEPPPMSCSESLVPEIVEKIVRRCLDKNPDNRWQTAGDVLQALRQASDSLDRTHTAALPVPRAPRRPWRWAAGVLTVAVVAVAAWFVTGGRQRGPTSANPGGIRTIAVLPLESPSGSEDGEYFADRLTEQLIAELAAVEGLSVISRTSVMRYEAPHKAVSAIARELRADAVLESALSEARGRVRFSSRLISSVSGDVLWAQDFERNPDDIRSLPREVADGVADSVGRTTKRERQRRPERVRPTDRAVHRHVLVARRHAGKGSEEGLQKAVEFFNAAIGADPSHAPAYAGLAEAYTELSGFYMDPREAMPKARQAAEMALRLDDGLAEAHAALGYVNLVYAWDGPAAARELRRALDLNPTLATARLNYAAYLSTQGRNEDAVREIRRAVDLDPVSVRTHVFGAMLLLFARHYDEAIDLSRRGLELEPQSGFMLAVQGVAFAEKARYDEAVDGLRQAVRLDDSLTVRALQAHVLAVAGRREQALAVLRTIEEAARHRYFCPYEIGTVYVSLGDFDRAAALFRQGTDERADCMAWLGVEPWIDAFRLDSRYPRLLSDIGLTPDPR